MPNPLRQVLFATGDVMAQQAVEKRGLENHDIARTGRMALYGGGTYLPPPSPSPSLTHPSSNLRPRRNNLVRLPPTARKPLHTHHYHNRPRRYGPTHLHTDQSACLPLLHGDYGGVVAKSEDREYVHDGDYEELDVVAWSAVVEFQCCAVGA